MNPEDILSESKRDRRAMPAAEAAAELTSKRRAEPKTQAQLWEAEPQFIGPEDEADDGDW